MLTRSVRSVSNQLESKATVRYGTVRMLSIGELSKAAGLPVKTLRFYHEKGVLIPARVEGDGYRYYDSLNLEAAQVILCQTL